LEKFNQFIQAIQNWFQKLTAVQKRHLALVCTVVFAALLTFSVLMSNRTQDSDDIYYGPDRINIFSPIPAEELFLPDEPDYLPGVILEREQRSSWTESDALEHWRDPLRFGEEKWRGEIEAAIDEFLERVP